MQKSNINPEILQQMLDSAANAAEKGQSQFFTPLDLARTLTNSLPKCRTTVTDLNCGAGALLQACVTRDTYALLGNDIDPHRPKVEGLERASHIERISQDATLFYGQAKEVKLVCDLFVLNPPWGLWWWRERLADLANSRLMAVRDAFAVVEARAPKGTIDSTIATLMMALDLCTAIGEGYLIGNNATLERLLFAPDAPYAVLAKHIWWHLVIPGNPMTGLDECLWDKFDDTKPVGPGNQPFQTGVIYFSRDHVAGPRKSVWPQQPDRNYHLGAELRYPNAATDPREAWSAIKERAAELAGKESRMPYNLWLNVGGVIRVGLSRFEQLSTKVNKKEAERLNNLDGKSPMELVLQRAQRDELLHVSQRGGWRVDPALTAAIAKATLDYHAARAPLYPLPEIQRLGYLDEQDTIECREDLELVTGEGAQRRTKVVYRKGSKYSIRTQTVIVKRSVEKPNPFTGAREELEFTGQELAIIIADTVIDPGQPTNGGGRTSKQEVTEYCFMDSKLKSDPTVSVTIAKRSRQRSGEEIMIAGQTEQKVDFTLQELAAHFLIPEVPDVATCQPEQYARNLDALSELEALTEALAA